MRKGALKKPRPMAALEAQAIIRAIATLVASDMGQKVDTDTYELARVRVLAYVASFDSEDLLEAHAFHGEDPDNATR